MPVGKHAAKLEDKGFGRKEPAPDAELAAFCTKALGALTKASGLLKKGIVPSKDTVSLLGKSSKMLAICLKEAGVPFTGPDSTSTSWADGATMRKAS